MPLVRQSFGRAGGARPAADHRDSFWGLVRRMVAGVSARSSGPQSHKLRMAPTAGLSSADKVITLEAGALTGPMPLAHRCRLVHRGLGGEE